MSDAADEGTGNVTYLVPRAHPQGVSSSGGNIGPGGEIPQGDALDALHAQAMLALEEFRRISRLPEISAEEQIAYEAARLNLVQYLCFARSVAMQARREQPPPAAP
ncbi:MAG: hypothetical protein B7Y95_19810 [Rhizobiales bacterium 32-66-11]|jgi:hypothetical protein|nr:MAG: hypothetical protein B7Z45_02470 [Azorhizobium sp. 12-66-6]OYX68656.1 MAG: hypothetical protein B7Y95_19810 [Rhizobiales bacterium 32-66-11]